MTGRRLFILGNSFSKPIPLNPFPFLYIPQFSRFTLLVYLTLSQKGAGGVHRVRVGDYLGRNDGKVVGISEGKIDVIEIVPDGEGNWLERPRSLTLKERS